MSLGQVDTDILGTLTRPGWGYRVTVAALLVVLGLGVYAFAYQVRTGLGVAGYHPPVLWAVYITDFVFWIGITHSGTLVSAVLFVLRASWRTGVARASEAMTVFALMTAGLFPIIHLGRPWYFYWLIPYPNDRHLWVNFRSPLIWDLFAITAYLTVSLLFLYLGMVPDFANLRDRARGWPRRVYALLSLGWDGSHRQWRHFDGLYQSFAVLVIPLAVSVHSIVSWDFAVSLLPGWHSTIFAPYFVVGAIFSGVAMMLVLLIPLRHLYRLEHYITVGHCANLAKLLLTMSLLLTYAYLSEFFTAWYSGHAYERAVFVERMVGPYASLFWTTVACNSIVPLALASGRVRRCLGALFTISIFVNIGMWLERYVLILGSLSHGLDTNGGLAAYRPTWVEVSVTAGSFALFALLFLLFVKLCPPVSMSDVKEEVAQAALAGVVPGPPPPAASGTGDMRAPTTRLVGVYDASAPAARAVAAMRHEGLAVEVFSPEVSRSLQRALQSPPSPVRFFVVGGAVAGCAAAFGFMTFTALDWPRITGGKPIVSLPPFTVIAFEVTVLLAALAGLVGFLLLARLPRLRGGAPDPRFTQDRYGVSVVCSAVRSLETRGLLERCGAVEVRQDI